MEPVKRVEFDRRIKLPVHALFVGASMSGKTRLVLHILSRPELLDPQPKTVIFYYDQLQKCYLEVKSLLGTKGISMHLRRGHDVNLDDLPHNDHQTIVLIDDASEETAASKEIARIATNGRHKNISLWLIWHSLYSKHAPSRIISQNTGLFFFLPSLRLESQLRTLGCQLGMKGRLVEAYHRCVEDEPTAEHRYLLLDLCPGTPALLRLRTNIHLPVQHCFQ